MTVPRTLRPDAPVRAEPLFAASVGRIGWALSHLTVALAGSVVLLAATVIAARLIAAELAGFRRRDIG